MTLLLFFYCTKNEVYYDIFIYWYFILSCSYFSCPITLSHDPLLPLSPFMHSHNIYSYLHIAYLILVEYIYFKIIHGMLYFIILHFFAVLFLPPFPLDPMFLGGSGPLLLLHQYIFTYLNLVSTCERQHSLFLSLAYYAQHDALRFSHSHLLIGFSKWIFQRHFEVGPFCIKSWNLQTEWFQLFQWMIMWPQVALTQIISHIVIDVVFLPHQKQFCL